MAPWRWWDGRQWTGHCSAGGRPPGPSVSPVELRQARAREERTFIWARRALVAVLVVLAGQWFGAIWFSHDVHRVWDEIQLNNGDGQVAQVRGFSVVYDLYVQLFYLVAGGLSIVFFIWQHSAATVARGLGYPSRISPGLGVGSWFIPVVNLWFPYWALCDTLPPGHPMRGGALWAWLAYLSTLWAGAATFVVALVSTTMATVVVMIISGALGLVAIALGAQLMTAVQADHRRRLGPP